MESRGKESNDQEPYLNDLFHGHRSIRGRRREAAARSGAALVDHVHVLEAAHEGGWGHHGAAVCVVHLRQTAQRERPPVAPAVVLPLWMRESIAEIVADLGETARDISERLALGSGTLNPSVRSPRPLQDHLRRHGPQHHYKTSTSRCLGRPRGGGVLDRSHRLRSACCCVGHSSAHSTKVPLQRQ